MNAIATVKPNAAAHVAESLFTPQARACAQCAHWSGARRALGTGSGIVVMARNSESVRARCAVSSMARSASEACSRFKPAFN